jgi:hypothetical protein
MVFRGLSRAVLRLRRSADTVLRAVAGEAVRVCSRNMLRLAAALALTLTAHGQASDPTSLGNSQGLDPSTMCDGTQLNTTWGEALIQLSTLACTLSSTQVDCLYETDSASGVTSLKDPPMCIVSRACALAASEVCCMVQADLPRSAGGGLSL